MCNRNLLFSILYCSLLIFWIDLGNVSASMWLERDSYNTSCSKLCIFREISSTTQSKSLGFVYYPIGFPSIRNVLSLAMKNDLHIRRIVLFITSCRQLKALKVFLLKVLWTCCIARNLSSTNVCVNNLSYDYSKSQAIKNLASIKSVSLVIGLNYAEKLSELPDKRRRIFIFEFINPTHKQAPLRSFLPP